MEKYHSPYPNNISISQYYDDIIQVMIVDPGKSWWDKIAHGLVWGISGVMHHPSQTEKERIVLGVVMEPMFSCIEYIDRIAQANSEGHKSPINLIDLAGALGVNRLEASSPQSEAATVVNEQVRRELAARCPNEILSAFRRHLESILPKVEDCMDIKLQEGYYKKLSP